MSDRVRIRTGLFQAADGRWRLMFDLNGEVTTSGKSWATEGAAEAAARAAAAEIRKSMGAMQ